MPGSWGGEGFESELLKASLSVPGKGGARQVCFGKMMSSVWVVLIPWACGISRWRSSGEFGDHILELWREVRQASPPVQSTRTEPCGQRGQRGQKTKLARRNQRGRWWGWGRQRRLPRPREFRNETRQLPTKSRELWPCVGRGHRSWPRVVALPWKRRSSRGSLAFSHKSCGKEGRKEGQGAWGAAPGAFC